MVVLYCAPIFTDAPLTFESSTFFDAKELPSLRLRTLFWILPNKKSVSIPTEKPLKSLSPKPP
jgi:hypothetical protein